jgi:uncharacterized membrane protein
MRTPASVAGHPIHPMLVTIPIGLWLFSFVCDLILLKSENPDLWETLAFYAMAGGVIGALAAAIPGTIDMLSLSGQPRKTAQIHMGINLAVVALYAVNLWLRLQGSDDEVEKGPIIMSAVTVVMLAISGWLGGHLVYRHGVAVNTTNDD